MSSKTDTNSDPRVDYIQNVVLGSCNIKIGTLSPSIFQDNEVFEISTVPIRQCSPIYKYRTSGVR